MEFQKCDELRTTTHHWEYRELSAGELLMVGGGGDGDAGGCDAGGSCDTGGSAASNGGGEIDASLGCNALGGLVGVAVADVAGPVAGVLAGALATEMCERSTG